MKSEWDIILGRVSRRGFFRSASPTIPPAEPAPTEENEAAKRAAEAAAATERERLRKDRRPTLLTSYSGAQGEAELFKAQLSGEKTGKSTLG